jgi:hypothetical protein
MRFGTWKVRRLRRSELLKTVVKEVSNYRLGMEGVQEGKWGKVGTEQRITLSSTKMEQKPSFRSRNVCIYIKIY